MELKKIMRNNQREIIKTIKKENAKQKKEKT